MYKIGIHRLTGIFYGKIFDFTFRLQAAYILDTPSP